jgi:hypothetical protein
LFDAVLQDKNRHTAAAGDVHSCGKCLKE